jgi:tetratricopeptide (TPR) repeat protein
MNKTLFFLLTVFFITPNTALAEYYDQSPLFRQANKLYQKEDMSQALELYNQISEKGYAVWYNMGNCYYYLADYARAMACWRRAQHQVNSLAEFDATQHNIELAAQALGKKQQKNMLSFVLRRSAKAISPFVAQLFFILCSCALLLLGKKLYAEGRFGTLSTLGGCWVLLSLLVLLHYDEHTMNGIVVTDSAVVRAGPHEERQTIGVLPQGYCVAVKQKQSAWYNVAADGMAGWISAQDIEVV